MARRVIVFVQRSVFLPYIRSYLSYARPHQPHATSHPRIGGPLPLNPSTPSGKPFSTKTIPRPLATRQPNPARRISRLFCLQTVPQHVLVQLLQDQVSVLLAPVFVHHATLPHDHVACELVVGRQLNGGLLGPVSKFALLPYDPRCISRFRRRCSSTTHVRECFARVRSA